MHIVSTDFARCDWPMCCKLLEAHYCKTLVLFAYHTAFNRGQIHVCGFQTTDFKNCWDTNSDIVALPKLQKWRGRMCKKVLTTPFREDWGKVVQVNAKSTLHFVCKLPATCPRQNSRLFLSATRPFNNVFF